MLFKISLYDGAHVILQPNAEVDVNAYSALVSAIREEAPQQRWTTQDGLRGWVMPANQPTIEFIEDRWVEGVDYELAKQAKAVILNEKVEREIQKSRATKRWEYLFEGKQTEYKCVLGSGADAYDHQNVAVETMVDMPHFALLMEMGTGKTLCICAELDEYFRRLPDGHIFKALIVCPKPLRVNWQRELLKFTGDVHDIHIEILDSAVKGAQGLVDLMTSQSAIKIGIISYDSVRSIVSHLKLFAPDYLCYDESHYMKSPSTQRWKANVELADTLSITAGKKRILTGTPVGNNVGDLWSQFEILKRGVLGSTTYKGFLKQYAMLESHGDWTTSTGYRDVDRLRTLMARNSFIVRKEQCLDLPDKIYETRYIEMPPKMRDVYMEFYNTLSTEIDGKVLETSHLIAQLTKLSQMCSGFVNIPEETNGHFTLDGMNLFEIKEQKKMKTVEIPGGDAKMKEMLSEAMEAIIDGKLIIWARFHHDIDKLVFELQMQGTRCVKFDGRMSDLEKQKAVDAFNSDDSVRIFIGQQQAGGVGLTLLGTEKVPTKVVYYYSNNYSYMQRNQSEDRCHRIGLKNTIVYVDWVYQNSIDEVIAHCLQAKKELSDLIKDVEGIRGVLLTEPEDDEAITRRNDPDI